MNEVFRKYLSTVTLIFTVVIVLYQAFFIHNQMLQHADNICVMDSIRFVLAGRVFSIVIILIVIWYMYMTKNDYNAMLIVRIENKKRLWWNQCKKILIVSFVITLFLIFSSLILGMFNSDTWLNWSSQASFYASGTDPKGIYLTSNISITQIILIAFLLLYIQIAITLCFVVFGYWSFNSYIAPLIIIVAVAIIDAFTSFGPFFYRRYTITSNDWSNLDLHLWNKFIILIAILMGIICLGTFIANRKEFIGDEKM